MPDGDGGNELAELVASARLWAVNVQPYLASLLFALTLVPVTGTGTFGVDSRFRLYVDPTCFTTWTIEQAGAVLIHEAQHLLRDHGGRADALGVAVSERLRFNVAADLEINDDLTTLLLPPGACLPALFDLPVGELAESYFMALEGRPLAGTGWGDCGDGARGGRTQEPGDVVGVSPGEADLIRQQVAQEVRRLTRAGQSVGRGVELWAERWLTPQVDWRRQLAGLVRVGVGNAAGRVDYSYARPSRRSGSPLFDGIVSPSLVAPAPRVALVVDTSGSMGASLLGQALAEVNGVLRSCNLGAHTVDVLSCDAEVQRVQRVMRGSAVRLFGGGGTDLRVGIGAAAALRPRPQVVIVLTDGYTPWPDRQPVGVRVVVGLLGWSGGDSEPPPGWASVVRIPAT